MKHNSFNQTAYRILKLFQWLSEKPMTFQEINERFETDSRIGRRVSQDTLWFYINTLKAVGCQISRPTPKNQYCYHLSYHPFTYFLTYQDLEVLKDAVNAIDEELSYHDFLVLTQWLRSVFQKSANRDRNQLETQFFDEVRFANLCHLDQEIKDIEAHCQANQILKVQYDVPLEGTKTYTVLPLRLFYEQGYLYILCQREDCEQTSMLRLDRVQKFTPIDSPELSSLLKKKVARKPALVLKIFDCSLQEFEPIGEPCEVYPDPSSRQDLIVKLWCDNEFLIKQKLLASGYSFQVIQPLSFKSDIEQTLQEMRQIYLE